MTRMTLNANARRLALSLVSGLLLFGCDESVDTPPAAGSGDGSGQGTGSGDGSGGVDETSIAIAGDYDTSFGGFFRVTDTALDNDWYEPSSHTVVDWSNAEGWILAQNDASDAFNPNLYSRQTSPSGTKGSTRQSASTPRTRQRSLSSARMTPTRRRVAAVVNSRGPCSRLVKVRCR